MQNGRTSQHGWGSHQSKFSLRLIGGGEHEERAKVLDLLAIALQVLSPLSCAPVKELSLASVASRIVNPILVPLWRSASNCQLTRPQKRVRWQSQGVQTRSRHWQPALWLGLAASPVSLLARAMVSNFTSHQRNATLKNGGKRPERSHCCEQQNVLWRGCAGWKDGCAHVSSALGSALSQARSRSPRHHKIRHFWPSFLCRHVTIHVRINLRICLNSFSIYIFVPQIPTYVYKHMYTHFSPPPYLYTLVAIFICMFCVLFYIDNHLDYYVMILYNLYNPV